MIETIKDSIRAIYVEANLSDNKLCIPSLRRRAATFGIPSLDLYGSGDGQSLLSARQMAEIFAFCGELDLDLRDLPGIGHARIILLASQINAEQHRIVEQTGLGNEFLAVAITEEQAGSDLHSMDAVAISKDGGYAVSGKKAYVARLEQATKIIVFTKTENRDADSAFSAFIIPTNAPGLKYSVYKSMGLNGTSLGAVQFDAVFVPSSMCIDCPGAGIKLFNKHFSYWRTAMAAAAIGSARSALKQALEWLMARNAFSGPIGRFMHLQQDLSRHAARIRMAWSLVASTMDRIDSGKDSFIHAAMAKAEAVEIAIEAVDWSMRIHGAKGYTDQLDLEKRLRDLIGLRIADGTTDVLRSQVARGLLGDNIYEMSLGRLRSAHTEHPLLVRDLLGYD